METHWDADQSGGTFLTEKTFKPIKHGQMFFVAGPAGSLQALRDLGYKTFDTVLDTMYDRIEDNTQRWIRLCDAVAQARHRLADRFETARADIEHNQQLFAELKTQRLNSLIKDIHEQYN
jgi:ABC-type transporter Mla subunit MlaD